MAAGTEADALAGAGTIGQFQAKITVSQLLGASERGGLVRLILLDIALPWLAVRGLEGLGVATVPAFAAASLFPLGSVLRAWLRRRRVEVIGAAVAATLLLGAALALVSQDVRFSVVKAAPAYGLFGIACLASLFASRPLMFHVARHFSTGGDQTAQAAWDARLALPGFMRSMRRLTWVWGLATLAESALGIASAVLLPPSITLVAEPALAFATTAGLLLWTVAFARRRAAGGAP